MRISAISTSLTKDGAKIDRLLYAGNLEKARQLFANTVKHRPRIRLTIRQRARVLEQRHAAGRDAGGRRGLVVGRAPVTEDGFYANPKIAETAHRFRLQKPANFSAWRSQQTREEVQHGAPMEEELCIKSAEPRPRRSSP